ncbi:hypothetical protein NUW54_g12177 [Trametes sanguinea]|uniref:Uncharacterized protein n=1 Tax=Trametes sanguinea TaxID=158606 RepID=A0ACC1N0T6_9APHY|nr:hypothetical protein NUW54_g12177 [Trametes sanguinea]
MFAKPRCRTGAAFRAYRAGRLLVRRGIACGRGTSYDAEMMAGGMGLAFATKQSCETIHVVADNESALETLIDPGMHGQQLVSIVACRNVREWLSKDPRRKIEFHWCPSHEGIEWNELVDQDAKQAADLPLERDECSLAHAKHLLSVQMKSDWREEYRRSPVYAGRNFLRLRAFDPPNHVSSPALKEFGHSRTAMARYCRAILNHAPLGSFRQRFFPNEPSTARNAATWRRSYVKTRVRSPSPPPPPICSQPPKAEKKKKSKSLKKQKKANKVQESRASSPEPSGTMHIASDSSDDMPAHDAHVIRAYKALDQRAKLTTRLGSSYEHLYQAARMLPRYIGAIFNEYWEVRNYFRMLKKHFPGLAEQRDYLRVNTDLVGQLAQFMHSIAGKTRSDDAGRIRRYIYEIAGWDDATLEVKTERGFRHVVTGRLLCPVMQLDEFDADPNNTRDSAARCATCTKTALG